MAELFLKITDASNEEAAQMFSAICTDVIKQNEREVKEMMGIPKDTPATTKDLISLIQDSNLKCEITVFYEAKAETTTPVVEEVKAEVKTEVPAEQKTGDDLPF